SSFLTPCSGNATVTTVSLPAGAQLTTVPSPNTAWRTLSPACSVDGSKLGRGRPGPPAPAVRKSPAPKRTGPAGATPRPARRPPYAYPLSAPLPDRPEP